MMWGVKTLHAYLTRQVIGSLLMTMIVFTFVLLIGNILKEILTLMVNRQATMGVVVEAVGLLVPFVWGFALPMAMLTATLLVFGRFSADQELTAARAGGVSLLSLTTPILLLSLLLCGLSAIVNLELAPRCRVAYKNLLFKFRAELLSVQLPEGRFLTDSRGFTFYVGRNRKHELRDIMVVKDDGTNGTQTIRSPRGRLHVDTTNQLAFVELFDVTVLQAYKGTVRDSYMKRYSIDLLNEKGRSAKKPGISDLTFSQLRDEMRTLENRMHLPVPSQDSPGFEVGYKQRKWERQRTDLASPLRVQMHRQVSFSFACFAFTLIGIPLGIRVHRRETNVSFAIALGLVLIYYSFMVLGQSLATHSEWAPHLIVWLPNFIFQAVGAVLLWRANRGM